MSTLTTEKILDNLIAEFSDFRTKPIYETIPMDKDYLGEIYLAIPCPFSTPLKIVDYDDIEVIVAIEDGDTPEFADRIVLDVMEGKVGFSGIVLVVTETGQHLRFSTKNRSCYFRIEEGRSLTFGDLLGRPALKFSRKDGELVAKLLD